MLYALSLAAPLWMMSHVVIAEVAVGLAFYAGYGLTCHLCEFPTLEESEPWVKASRSGRAGPSTPTRMGSQNEQAAVQKPLSLS